MAVYKAPLKDIQFVMNEVLDVSSLSKLPGYEDATPDTIHAILEEAGKLCENVLFPLNRSGDEEGCHLENGVVRTPKGFKEAYDQFREGGWTGHDRRSGIRRPGPAGDVSFAVQEMITASNMAFGMYPGLTHGAYEALALHGSDEQKKLYLPQAHRRHLGRHDVPHRAAVRHRPRPDRAPRPSRSSDGSYTITGTKIFISAGDHDLTENIVHLVLARMPDAPAGTKGISLFIVPKFLPKADGKRRRAQRHPLRRHRAQDGHQGLRDLRHELRRERRGWLVGELNKGMPPCS